MVVLLLFNQLNNTKTKFNYEESLVIFVPSNITNKNGGYKYHQNNPSNYKFRT